MMTTENLPRWAQGLLDEHPGAERPSEDNPMPPWLREELERVPLWYHIREASQYPRFAPPYNLINDVRRQPDLLNQVFELKPRLEVIAERMVREGVEHLVFIGCGSSFYNSVLGAFIFPRLAGTTAQAMEAWEFYNYFRPTGRKTWLVAQSATGGSFEVLAATRRAKDMGIPSLGLMNTVDSALGTICEETVEFPTGQMTGPDICVIPTRLIMMYLLALTLGQRLNFRDLVTERIARQLPAIPELVRSFLSDQDTRVEALARKYHKQTGILVIGGGPNWFTALEAALKIEEESLTPCRTYQTADYPHMAISLLAPDRTTMVFSPPGPCYERLHTCVRTAKAGGSPTVAVLLEGDSVISKVADDVIFVPGDVDEMLFPPLGTIVGQLYGYYLAVQKGVNPDCLGTDKISHARAWLTSFPLGTH